MTGTNVAFLEALEEKLLLSLVCITFALNFCEMWRLKRFLDNAFVTKSTIIILAYRSDKPYLLYAIQQMLTLKTWNSLQLSWLSGLAKTCRTIFSDSEWFEVARDFEYFVRICGRILSLPLCLYDKTRIGKSGINFFDKTRLESRSYIFWEILV